MAPLKVEEKKVRGRKPKPTVLKILAGNPGKRELSEREPAPTGLAKCPSWLDFEAKKEWARIAPELERLGLLTMVDQAALAAYCQAWAEFKGATDQLRSEGRVYYTEEGEPKPHPAVARQKAAWAAIRGFAAEFGLSPSARTRVKSDGGKGDDLDYFLSG